MHTDTTQTCLFLEDEHRPIATLDGHIVTSYAKLPTFTIWGSNYVVEDFEQDGPDLHIYLAPDTNRTRHTGICINA